MVGLVEVVLLWVVVVVVVPVRFLSFPTMSLKKTMRTMMVVAQWEVVLRLVLHVSEDVVLMGADGKPGSLCLLLFPGSG